MIDAFVKKIVRRSFRRSRDMFAEDSLMEKMHVARRIAEWAENGKIAVVYGGMDCDMSRWDNRVALIPANVMAYQKWYDGYMEGAEGPQWASIARPSDVADLKSESRDLALEAFEDGHAHVVYL
jgi:hypothetical protein